MPGEIEFIMQSADTSALDKSLADANKKIDETEQKAKITVSGILISLRGVTDILALYSAATGEQINVQALMLISMSLSSIMQVKAQAAVYMATPGLQVFGMMLLAMVPMLTGVITFIKSEQMRVIQRLDQLSLQNSDLYLDTIPY